jgi:hypothetical protein
LDAAGTEAVEVAPQFVGGVQVDYFDAAGRVWRLDVLTGEVRPYAERNVACAFFESADCTGVAVAPTDPSFGALAGAPRTTCASVVGADPSARSWLGGIWTRDGAAMPTPRMLCSQLLGDGRCVMNSPCTGPLDASTLTPIPIADVPAPTYAWPLHPEYVRTP